MSLESLKKNVESQESSRKPPEDMSDDELMECIAKINDNLAGAEESIQAEIDNIYEERDLVVKPIYEQLGVLLDDKDHFPDEETFDQVNEIDRKGFGSYMNKLDSEEVASKYGKGIIYLNKIGVLSDEAASQLASFQDDIDNKLEEKKEAKIESDDETPYFEEYNRRELWAKDK